MVWKFRAICGGGGEMPKVSLFVVARMVMIEVSLATQQKMEGESGDSSNSFCTWTVHVHGLLLASQSNITDHRPGAQKHPISKSSEDGIKLCST